MDGHACLVFRLHNAVDGEVQARHDQLKFLGRVDRNVAVYRGAAFALRADCRLIDDVAIFRRLIGILCQNVELEAVRQFVACGIHIDVAIVLAFADHDGNVRALRRGSAQRFLDRLVDGIVGLGFSGSDVCIVGGILRSIIIILLQGAELFVRQLLLYIFRGCDGLIGTLDYDVIGDGQRVRLYLIRFGDGRCTAGRAAAGRAAAGRAAGARRSGRIGRLGALVDNAGIVIDLRLNHRGEIVAKGQVLGALSLRVHQSIQIIGFRA